MSLFTITITLLLIMDPLGNLKAYLSLIKELHNKRRHVVLVREMCIVLAAMFICNYLGEYIFTVLGLSETTLRLSSAIILFMIGIKILFSSNDNPRTNLPKGEPLIFPFAIPLMAGPALLATIMLYAHLESSQSLMLAAILISWTISFFMLWFATPIQRLLKDNGLNACERLIGMILILISVQRFLEGILLFWSTYKHNAI